MLYAEGNRGKVNFNLRDYSTKSDVLAAVDRIRYLGENTNTTGGLKVARLEVFGRNYHYRPNVERIIVLITDGVPTYDKHMLNDEVAAIKRAGIRIVGLGVTHKVSISSHSINQSFYSFVYSNCFGYKTYDFSVCEQNCGRLKKSTDSRYFSR